MVRVLLLAVGVLVLWVLFVWGVGMFFKGCEFETETAKCSCDLEKTLEDARRRAEQEAQQTPTPNEAK